MTASSRSHLWLFFLGVCALTGGARAEDWVGVNLKFKDAAVKRQFDAQAARCKGDSSCYATLILQESAASGTAAGRALALLPDAFWGPMTGYCKGQSHGSQLASMSCIDHKIDAIVNGLKSGVAAINRDGLKPDDPGFPAIDPGVLPILRKACDLAEKPQGSMSAEDALCVADALGRLSARFSDAARQMKQAYNHLSMVALASGLCAKDPGVPDAKTCQPEQAHDVFKDEQAKGAAQSAAVDLAAVAGGSDRGGSGGGGADGKNQAGSAGGRSTQAESGTHGAASAGTEGFCPGGDCGKTASKTSCSGGGCDDPVNENYIDVNACEKRLGAATPVTGGGNAACRPSENAAIEGEVGALAQACQTLQQRWDPTTQRALDVAQEQLRDSALNYVQVLSESNLGSCGFAKALDRLPSACGSTRVSGRAVTGFSEPLQSVVSAARARYLKDGDHCDQKDSGFRWASGRDNELLNAAHDAHETGALAAARELSQLDASFGTLSKDFAANEGDFFKSYPGWLPCRSVLNVVGYIKNASTAVCKDVQRRVGEGGLMAEMSVAERLESDEFGDGSPQSERGNALKQQINSLRQQLTALAQSDPAGYETRGASLTADLGAKQAELEGLRSNQFTDADRLLEAGIPFRAVGTDPSAPAASLREPKLKSEGLAHRCFTKAHDLEKIMGRMAELKTQYPELDVQANGEPVYRAIGPLVGSNQQGQARSRYAEATKDYWRNGSDDPAKDATQNYEAQIGELCSDPVGVAKGLLSKNDNLFNNVYACSTQVGDVMPEFLRVEEERAAACRARRDGRGNPCKELADLRESAAKWDHAAAGFDAAMKAFDTATCAAMVYGGVGALGKILISGSVSAAKGLVVEGAKQGVKNLVKQTTSRVGVGMVAGFTGYGAYEAYHITQESKGAAVLAREGLISGSEVAALREASDHVAQKLVLNTILGVAAGGMAFELGNGIAEVAGAHPRTVSLTKTPELSDLYADAVNKGGGRSPLEIAEAQMGLREQVIQQVTNSWGGSPVIRDVLETADFGDIKRIYEKGKYVVPEHPADVVARIREKQRDAGAAASAARASDEAYGRFEAENKSFISEHPAVKAADEAYRRARAGGGDLRAAQEDYALAIDAAIADGGKSGTQVSSLQPIVEELRARVASGTGMSPDEVAALSPQQLYPVARRVIDSARRTARAVVRVLGRDPKTIAQLDRGFFETLPEKAIEDANGQAHPPEEVLAKRRDLASRAPDDVAHIIKVLKENCHNAGPGDDVKIREFVDRIAVSEYCPQGAELTRLAALAGLRMVCAY